MTFPDINKPSDKGWKTPLFALLASAAVGSWMKWEYDHAYIRAHQRLAQFRTMMDTSFGKLEYYTEGQGPAVLVLHGLMGDYHKSLQRAKVLRGKPYQLITLSRPGYSQTELQCESLEDEASMYVECLDELGVEKTFVIAASASGPAALTFARNHPDRCAGLVLLAAISKPLTLTKLHLNETASLFMQVINNDVAAWLLYNTLIRLLPLRARLNRVIRERIFEDVDGYHRYLESVREYFPMSAHRAGFDHDRSQLAELSDMPLKDIQQPTLIIHGTDDTTVPVEHGEHMAAHIPDSELIRVEPDASHDFFVTHHNEIWKPILKFLDTHTSDDEQ